MESQKSSGGNREDRELEDFLEWVKGQKSLSKATRVLSKASGIKLGRKALERIRDGKQWDRSGRFRRAWLAHPDSGPSEPAPARGNGGQESGDSADDTDKFLPEGMPLEDMIAVIDARPDAEAGENAGGQSAEEVAEDSEWGRQRVLQATTVEEIAAAAGAPVLAEVTDLDIEDARACGLMKGDGWSPTDRERTPPGLHGDGPILLFLGEEVSFADEGARRLAFAPANEWEEDGPYCAQQMRYGVSMDTRQRRYAVEPHHDRPAFIGIRRSDWAPEAPYVDSNHFFGSGGFQRADGAWMPSRAEALAYLYHLRAIERAFRDTPGSGDSPYLLTVRKTLLELEYMLLSGEYRMSFHHHGVGRSVDDSARSAERRRLEAEIPELERRIRQERRRIGLGRSLRGILTAPVRAARRIHRRAPPEPAGDLSGLPVEESVSGESEWRALDPPWEGRDRTLWYEAGTGPLSPDSSGEGDMLPVPGARFVPAGPEESLLRVRPPRAGEFGLSGFRSVLDSLGEGHVVSLEIVGGGGETELLVRTVHPDRVVSSLELHYPGVQFERVAPEDDPLRLREGEAGWRRILRPRGPEYLPFRVPDERDELTTADPLLDVIGAVDQELHGGERLLSRMVLRQKPHDWSEKWRARALSGPGSENAQAAERERQQARDGDARTGGGGASSGSESGGDVNPFGAPLFLIVLAIVGLGAMAALGVWFDSVVASVGMFTIIAYAAAGVTITGLLGFLAWRVGAVGAVVRFFRPAPPVYHDPDQVAVRISGGAYEFEVQLIAVLGERSERVRADRLLEPVVNAYRSFDAPLGARFAAEGLRQLLEPNRHAGLSWWRRRRADVLGPEALVFGASSRGRGIFTGRPQGGIVGVREAAVFWHLPGGSVELPSVRRVQSRRLRPPAAAMAGGALVGVAHDAVGGQRPVYFPEEMQDRHKFLVARTRMGKSTMMCHIGGESMAAKARGESEDALVVIDPHADLVRDLLRRVPEELVDRVVLVDLDDEDRAVGINVLDTRVFRERDKAVQAVIEVAQGIDETWGTRMDSILTHVLRSLYEANRTLPADRQLTMLDGSLMLSDPNFRDAVLDRVKDELVIDWWRAAHGGWSQDYSKDAIAPVLTRLSRFAGSEVARAILGQRRCTLDLREVIRRGDVLLVNTNQGAVGRDVSALIGVSVLKLIETLITEQGTIADADRRRRVSVIVDEIHTLSGANFSEILSQIGKRGGILTVATQSLASLDILGETMREDVLANSAVLITFQTNALDAKRLLPELRSEYLEEADITGLPVHHCFVRLIGEGEVDPPFTMEVLPPLDGDPRIEEVIKHGTRRYTSSRERVLSELNASVGERVKHFRVQIRERLRTRGRDARVDLGGSGGGERTSGESTRKKPTPGERTRDDQPPGERMRGGRRGGEKGTDRNGVTGPSPHEDGQ